MAKKKSELLAEQITAKHREAMQLNEKGEARTPEESAKMRTLATDVKTLRAEYDAETEAEKSLEDSRVFVDTLTGETVNIKHGTQPGRGGVEGFEAAGETVIGRGRDQKGRDYFEKVYEEGAGMLSQKELALMADGEYKRAFRNYLRGGEKRLTGAEFKVLNEGVDAQGGFLVPDDVLSRIISKDPTPTRVAGRVTRLTTSRDAITMPKVNYTTDDIYTTGIRVVWSGEQPASGATHRQGTAAGTAEPAFGQVRIPVHTAMLSMLLTNDQVEDVGFPLVGWTSDKFSETADLLFDNMTLNGTGLGQPAGILLNPGGTGQPAIVKTGSAALLTADGLIDLDYSVPEQYMENLVYIMNRTNGAKNIAKLKDSQNRYLFSMGGAADGGLQGKRPDQLLGKDILYSGFMPNVGANNFPIVFGDPRGYYLVNRIGFSIQVLRERYAEENQVLLLGRLRLGGQVAEDWRLKAHKCST
jgi:HK97 family phage major capsid protein